MNQLLKIITVASTIFYSISSFASGYTVIPTHINFDYKHPVTNTVTVKNLSKKRTTLKLLNTFLPFKQSATIFKDDRPLESPYPYDLSAYLKLSPSRLVIYPESMRSFRYRITLPADAAKGTYFTYIKAEMLPPEANPLQNKTVKGTKISLTALLNTLVPMYINKGKAEFVMPTKVHCTLTDDKLALSFDNHSKWMQRYLFTVANKQGDVIYTSGRLTALPMSNVNRTIKIGEEVSANDQFELIDIHNKDLHLAFSCKQKAALNS